jgi:hypothetical protein
MLPTNRNRLAVFPLFLILTACTHNPEISDHQRRESFSTYQDSKIAGEPLTEYLQTRTAVLLTGTPVIDANVKGQSLYVDFPLQAGDSINGPAHAVAIEPDGYFLTAAHCMETNPVYLIYFDGKTTRIVIPRLVAKSFDPQGNVDIALIHIPFKLSNIFTWAGEEDTKIETPALAVGCTDGKAPQKNSVFFAQCCLAGKIKNMQPTNNGGTTIKGNLPLRNGDSGGPLVTLNGKLLAIDTGGLVGWMHHPTSVAFRPDIAWVNQAIDKDRQLAMPEPQIPIPTTSAKEPMITMIISLLGDPAIESAIAKRNAVTTAPTTQR